jgi:hypothetical protein
METKDLVQTNAFKIWDAVSETGEQDPIWWMENVLRVRLYDMQCEVVRVVRDYDRVAVKSGHGVGKGYVSACIAIWWALVKHGLVLVTAPTWAQVEDVWFATLRKVLAGAMLPASMTPAFGVRNDRWMLGPLWGILGIASDKPSNLQGYHAENVLLIADEAAGIDDRLFETFEGSQVSRGVGEAKILLLGNPTRKDGFFGRAFDDGGSRAYSAQNWRTLTISCYDSPNVTGEMEVPGLATRDWIAERESDWEKISNAFRVRVQGEFPVEGAIDRMIPEHVLVGAIHYSPKTYTKSGTVQGVDVARFGDDATVSVIIRDGAVVDVASVRQFSTTDVAEWVHLRARAHGVTMTVVDETGLGGVVVDELRRRKVNVTAVNFASAPERPDRWGDLRSEMAFALCEAFKSGTLCLPVSTTIEVFDDIRALRYEIAGNGTVILEAKQHMKHRLGRSPDFVDALMIAWKGFEELPVQTPLIEARMALENALSNVRRQIEGGRF